MKRVGRNDLRVSRERSRNGMWAEELACTRLVENGLTPLERNWRSRYGEIDLIMYDGEILVFVEVRYRQGRGPVTALDSIGPIKRRKLIHTALAYLGRCVDSEPPLCRFDVVTVSGARPRVTVDWIRDAFPVS